MTAARNVSANSSAVTDRRYSHPRAKSRDDRYETLHLPIVILRQAKDLTYSWGSHKVHWHLRDLMWRPSVRAGLALSSRFGM